MGGGVWERLTFFPYKLMVLELLLCFMPLWLREGFLGMPYFLIAGDSCSCRGPGFSREGLLLARALEHWSSEPGPWSSISIAWQLVRNASSQPCPPPRKPGLGGPACVVLIRPGSRPAAPGTEACLASPAHDRGHRGPLRPAGQDGVPTLDSDSLGHPGIMNMLSPRSLGIRGSRNSIFWPDSASCSPSQADGSRAPTGRGTVTDYTRSVLAKCLKPRLALHGTPGNQVPVSPSCFSHAPQSMAQLDSPLRMFIGATAPPEVADPALLGRGARGHPPCEKYANTPRHLV